MARKSKLETQEQVDGIGAEQTARGADGNARTGSKAIGAAQKPKRKKAAQKKTARANKPAAPTKSSSSGSIREPSDEEIRIRAYFIAERRIQLSLEGDSAHDWVEARRQLVEEANRAAS